MNKIHALRRGAAAAFLLLGSGGVFAAPSLQFTVTGEVDNPAVYTGPDLQALPSVTQNVTYGSGSGTQTHTYVGPTTWSVLNRAGIQVNPNVRNDILDKYVVAVGSDGYRSVFSLGELNPNFGNRQSILAHSEIVGGNTVGLGNDGFARITSPGDVKGGRYVSNLVELSVHDSGSKKTGTGGGRSTAFTVSGAVNQVMNFDLDALLALPSITRVVGTNTYKGVSFWDLLNSTVGIVTNGDYKNDILNMYVVATGSDGYQSLFSMGELNPNFGNQPDMIAYELNGELLTTSGFARIVAPNDVRNGRYVSNLISLEVFSAARVPEPEALSLLALAGGMLIWTRRLRG